MKQYISIDSTRCKACYLCVNTCPKKVIEAGTEFNPNGYQFAVPVRNEDCIGCRQCAFLCPDLCITVYKED